MREGKNHNIQIDIDHDLGEIKFNGLVKNMMPVRDKINKIVRSYEKAKHEQQQAKLLANIVRWYYLKGNKQFPFPDDVNKTIEEAYKKKDAKVKVKDRSGGEYEIDFSSMTEHDVKNAKEKFTVLRRDVMEGKCLMNAIFTKTMSYEVNCCCYFNLKFRFFSLNLYFLSESRHWTVL